MQSGDRGMIGYLRVVVGPDEGLIFELAEGDVLLIGRGEKSDTHLKDLQVSRVHCELKVASGRVTLTDMESVGGTLVNAQRIKEKPLRNNDLIQIGGTQIKLHLAGISDADALLAAQKPQRELHSDAGKGPMIGQTISHFEIVSQIARGRTGILYKARDNRDGKDVAFKLLFEGFADDEEDLQRFIRGMTTAISLRHPNIVSLFAAGKHGKSCWLAMEYVDGVCLTKVIERIGIDSMLDWKYALAVGTNIARALEAAHAQQIIHRNVMPENIMIRKADRVAKLGDMMLAKALSGIKAKAITKPGELVGNLRYMAPERTKEEADVDTRSDVYSLGATMYSLLTGHPPFDAKSLIETIALIRQSDPVPPKKFQPEIPDPLQDLVLKMLAKRPELRFQTMAEVARALEKLSKNQGMDV
jgi:serine/threonine protein kinase